MKTKFIIPYLLGGTLTLATLANSKTHATPDATRDDNDTVKYDITATLPADMAPCEMTPYATSAFQKNMDVVYIMNTGDTIVRRGGSLAWRSNNPGNLIYGEFARENGAIGKNTRRFAIFPDVETGRAALVQLLRTDKYNKLTIAGAISKYAPSKENDVARYRRQLRGMTGLDLNLQICNLDSAQMEQVTDAICVIEGWRAGEETQKPGQDIIMADAQNQIIKNKMQRSL